MGLQSPDGGTPAPSTSSGLALLCRLRILPQGCSLNSTCKDGTPCESGPLGTNCSCQEGLVGLRWVRGAGPGTLMGSLLAPGISSQRKGNGVLLFLFLIDISAR